jgi:transcriptional antiterminator RfaH
MRDSSVHISPSASHTAHAGLPRDIDTLAQWYVVRTSFRHEKMACRDLERAGLHVWLPLLRENRIYATKRRVVEVPLFSAYLFVHLQRDAFHRVLMSPYTRGFVRFGHDILPISSHEIEIIRRVVGEGQIEEVCQRELKAGDPVEIIGGKLTGIRGVLENPRRNNMMSIRIESMGFTLVLDVDPRYLQRVHKGKYCRP